MLTVLTHEPIRFQQSPIGKQHAAGRQAGEQAPWVVSLRFSSFSDHAPLLTALKPGEIRVVKDGEDTYMAVSGGFMEVIGNKITILADTAERVEDIDVERAEEALKLAQEKVEARASDMDLERALSSIRRSQARLKVARRRRPRADRGAPPS